MIRRSHRSPLAALILALMLFAQAAMAWSACQWPERAPDRAIAAAAPTATEVAPCHAGGQAATCLAHCLADKQAGHKALFDQPSVSPVQVPMFALADLPLPDADRPLSPESAHAAGPPRRIRYQSFQL